MSEVADDMQISTDGLLRRAANNAEVYLLCHSDTWNFIHLWCRELIHFTEPRDEQIEQEETGGRILVPVSGRTLVAILHRMLNGNDADPSPAGQAMADHIVQAVAEALHHHAHPRSITLDPHPSDFEETEND